MDEEIVDRMMLPMVIESSRALGHGMVASPAELDMALLLGLGFPAHLGSPLRWADWLGLTQVNARAAVRAGLGKASEPTKLMRELASTGRGYYST